MLQNKLHLTKRPTTPNTIFNDGKGGISSYDMPPLPFQYATTYSRLNVRKAQPCLTTEHYNMHITQLPVCQRVAKGGKPHCKRPCFTVQKAAFCSAVCRKLERKGQKAERQESMRLKIPDNHLQKKEGAPLTRCALQINLNNTVETLLSQCVLSGN